MQLISPSSKTFHLMEESIADQDFLKQESVMFTMLSVFGQGRTSPATLPP